MMKKNSTGASDGEVNYVQFLHLLTITSTRMKAFLEYTDNSPYIDDEWLTSDEKEARKSFRRQNPISQNNPILQENPYPSKKYTTSVHKLIFKKSYSSDQVKSLYL